jgi:hypothetical protein
MAAACTAGRYGFAAVSLLAGTAVISSMSVFHLLVASGWVNTTTDSICDVFKRHTAKQDRLIAATLAGLGSVAVSFFGALWLFF